MQMRRTINKPSNNKKQEKKKKKTPPTTTTTTIDQREKEEKVMRFQSLTLLSLIASVERIVTRFHHGREKPFEIFTF